MSDSNLSKNWASSLFSYVTGGRKRKENEEAEQDSPPANPKRARLEPNLNESTTQPSFTSFNQNSSLNNSNIFNNVSLSSTDVYPSSATVLDLRSRIKPQPSRTKTILSELSKLRSNSNSFSRPLYLLENSKWIDSNSGDVSLPPRRSGFTPSRVQQISASMNKSARSERSFWLNDSFRPNETSGNASVDNSTNQSSIRSVSKPSEDVFVPEKTTPLSKVTVESSVNKFGYADLVEDELKSKTLQMAFYFEKPVVRGPRMVSVSPTPTESSNKSDGKKQSFDSDTSLSAESDQEPEKTPEIALTPPKPAAKKWECKVCLVFNEEERVECPCCGTARGQTEETPVSKSTPLSAFKPQTFAAPVNATVNGTSAFSFGATTPSSSSNSTTTPQPFTLGGNSTSATSLFGAVSGTSAGNGTTQKPPEIAVTPPKPAGKKWECKVCLVFNEEERVECPCCGTARGKTEETPVSKSTPSSAFKPQTFAAPVNGTANANSAFTFGTTTPSSSNSTTPAQPFTFGGTSTSATSLFGAASGTRAGNETAAPKQTITGLSTTGSLFGSTLSNPGQPFVFGSATPSLAPTSTPSVAPSATPSQPSFGGDLFKTNGTSGNQPFLFGNNSTPLLAPPASGSNIFAAPASATPSSNVFTAAPSSGAGRRILNARRRAR